MKTVFQIKGTHCKSCKMLIEDVVSEMPGVQSINVKFETGQTEVEHDEQLGLAELKRVIEAEGDYEVVY